MAHQEPASNRNESKSWGWSGDGGKTSYTSVWLETPETTRDVTRGCVTCCVSYFQGTSAISFPVGKKKKLPENCGYLQKLSLHLSHRLCGLLVFHGWEWESANEVLVLESVNDLGGRFTPQNVVFLLRATALSWGTCVHPIAMRRDPGSTVSLWDPSAENKWIYLINRTARKEMCNFFFSFSGCTFCNNRRWDVCRQKLTVLSQ